MKCAKNVPYVYNQAADRITMESKVYSHGKLFLSVVNVEEKLYQHEQCNILSTCSLTVTSNKRKVFLSGNIHFILPLLKFVH